MIVLKILNRVLAFAGKEVMEALRRPASMASLVLGPFVIMMIFGLGYGGYARPLTAMIVVPDGSSLSTNVEDYREYEQEGISIVGVTRDVEEARAMLRDGSVEVAIVAPTNAEAALKDGKQSEIRIEYAMIDPIRAGFVGFVGRQLSAEINRKIITVLVEQGQEIALREAGQSEFTALPPDVIASPTRAVNSNLAPTSPTIVGYYGPALVALILQHLAMTLAALSLVRERTTGAIEVLRISPVSAIEIVGGKVLGYAAIVGLVAVATFGVLIGIVGVPDLAGALPIAAVVALSTVASVGIGLLFAAISDWSVRSSN